MKNIKTVVAVHKPYKMPDDKMYLPLHAGKEGKADIGFDGDNTGENISLKNPYYCELTCLYWAWKNLDTDYVGLAHYRRHFVGTKIPKDFDKKFDAILSGEKASEIFEKTDIILPELRKYYIENLYDHYRHTLYVEPLDMTGEIISQKYPEYLPEFLKLHKRTSAHMFNMFIMKKELADKYCEWLFDILTELEVRIDPKQYDSFHARYLGRVSELLLDVWINTNDYSYSEVPVMDMEGVNWFKKGMSFLISKFTNQKYSKSF